MFFSCIMLVLEYCYIFKDTVWVGHLVFFLLILNWGIYFHCVRGDRLGCRYKESVSYIWDLCVAVL